METKKFSEETLSATVKKKNILLSIEYCLENKIEFIVTPAAGNDEFIIAFVVKDLPTAVALGMSVKDLKIELNGLPSFIPASAIKNMKRSSSPKEESVNLHEEAMLSNTIDFDTV